MNPDKFCHEYYVDQKVRWRDHQVCYYYQRDMSLEFISKLLKINEILVLFIVARNHIELREEHVPLMSKYMDAEHPFPPIDYGYIYMIYNDVTSMVYVGQTTSTLLMRWNEHMEEHKQHPNRKLYEHFSLVGIEHFNIKPLEIVPTEDLNDKEKEWIALLDCYKNGLNMTEGGNFERQFIKR